MTHVHHHHQKSYYSSLRQLQRSIHTSLKNHIFSILHDIRVLNENVLLDRDQMNLCEENIFLNLRTGAWYDVVRGTAVGNGGNEHVQSPNYCYFQSKNGHSETMAFSTLRFNPHVLLSAVKHHAACIIDATRRGKIYPDSILKTIPIWITVLNREVLGWSDAKMETHMKYVSKSEYERAMQVIEGYRLPEAVIRKLRKEILSQIENLEEWIIPFLETSSPSQVHETTQQMDPQSKSKRLFLKPIFINPAHPYNVFDHEFDHLPVYLVSASETERESKQQGTYTYLPGAGDDMEAWTPHKDFSADVFWRNFTKIDPHEDMMEEDLKEVCLEVLENNSPQSIPPTMICNPTIFIAELMTSEYVDQYDLIIQLASPQILKQHRAEAKHVHQFSVCNSKKFRKSLQKNFDQILSCVQNASHRILIVSIDPQTDCFLAAYAIAIMLNLAVYEGSDYQTMRPEIGSWSATSEDLKSVCMLCQVDAPQNFLSRLLHKQMKKIVQR
mmetsp:Transcript_9846/g.36713  ORF Transcript_9846/g.36713 Transcript_9846/m.36713 type:complete len:498 (-) Transcript_9846:1483-2976(-)